MLLTRRRLTGALAAGALAGTVPLRLGSAAGPMAVPADRKFDVLLGKSTIGQHVITFSPEQDGFRATTGLELKIKLLFITLFNMRHESQEVWQNGRLKELRSRTRDHGETYEVTADATHNGIRVESEDGSIVAPPGSFTSNDIWDATSLESDQVIDARNGGIVGLVGQRLGEEEVEVDGQKLRALLYRAITPDAVGQLWYADSRLVKARFEVRSETVDYRLVG